MINRKIDKEFECFHMLGRKEALLIDGARQVGKTFSIREYGKRHFEHIVEINFLKDRDAKLIFENVHDEKDVWRAIVLSTGNTDRASTIDYLPVYMVMFLDHDGLAPNLTFPKPSLDLPVSPHFKNR